MYNICTEDTYKVYLSVYVYIYTFVIYIDPSGERSAVGPGFGFTVFY